MNKILMARKKPLIKNVVLLNGISRAGKCFVGKIVSGLKGIEYFQFVSVLEQIPYIERLGRISEDAAVSLLQVHLDEHAYNMSIGRNLNFRFDDISGVHNSHEADRYLKRARTQLDNNLISGIRTGRRMPMFILHECLPNIKVYLKAFPYMKWINLLRHPIDVIHSWYVRGWGQRHVSDPLSFIPVVKGIGTPMPWYAYEWRKDYKSMAGMDRIISSVYSITRMGKEAYKTLNRKTREKIMFISFERLVTEPKQEITRLSGFLNTGPTRSLARMLKEERCPRILKPSQRQKKYEDIRMNSTPKKMRLVNELVADYEGGRYHGYSL